jgi:MoaA/NifB/PqqE/SkfB family radical SAM enzyme
LQHILIDAGLPAPRSLTLAITQGCNLACAHCWPENGAQAAGGPLGVKVLQRTIESFVSLGVKELCLTGGEPLTHPGWLEILKFARQQPGLETLRLQTNATLLGEAEAHSLAALDWPRFFIQISLDGASVRINDAMRGEGSFAAAWRGLNHLTQAGMAGNCSVAFTETRQNMHELPDLAIRLHRMGVGGLVSGTMVWAGRARLSGQLSLPEPRQHGELLERFHADAEFWESYSAMGNIAALEWYQGRDGPDESACKCGQTPYING